MHTRPLFRKGMRILPFGLCLLFRLGDGRSRVVAGHAPGIGPRGMRWWTELVGLFEDEGLFCANGGGGEMLGVGRRESFPPQCVALRRNFPYCVARKDRAVAIFGP